MRRKLVLLEESGAGDGRREQAPDRDLPQGLDFEGVVVDRRQGEEVRR
jgi:hypothetical protein